jgi:uncharacterized repeat protein (TIGR01451 family)
VGDQVATLGGSSATVTYFDGSETELPANSTMILRELDDGGPRRSIRLEAVQGSSLHRVVDRPEPGSFYRVDAHGNQVVVKGTVFAVHVDPNGDVTVVLERCGPFRPDCLEFPAGQTMTPGAKRTVTGRGDLFEDRVRSSTNIWNAVTNPAGDTLEGTENPGLSTRNHTVAEQPRDPKPPDDPSPILLSPPPPSPVPPATGAPSADLQVSQSGPSLVLAGGQAVYTTTVTNPGPGAADNVTLNSTPSGGLAFVSNTGACATAFPCALGTIPAGQSRTITTTFTTPGTVGTALQHTIQATTTTTDPAAANNIATVNTTTTAGAPSADLQVSQSGPSLVLAGGQAVYTTMVTNPGPGAADNVTLNSTPSGGLAFVSNTGACATAFPCALGTIPAGQSRTITTTFTTPGTIGTVLQHTVQAITTTTDLTATNNTATVNTTTTAPVADLVVQVAGPAFYGDPNIPVTYIISVSNLGPDAAAGVDLRPRPSETVGVANFNGNSGDCTTPYPCSLGTIPAGQSRIVNTDVQLTGAFNVKLTFDVSSSTADPNTANNTASKSTQLVILN